MDNNNNDNSMRDTSDASAKDNNNNNSDNNNSNNNSATSAITTGATPDLLQLTAAQLLEQYLVLRSKIQRQEAKLQENDQNYRIQRLQAKIQRQEAEIECHSYVEMVKKFGRIPDMPWFDPSLKPHEHHGWQ